MPGDFIELVDEAPPGSLAAQAGKAVPERLGHGLRLGLTRELGQGLGTVRLEVVAHCATLFLRAGACFAGASSAACCSS